MRKISLLVLLCMIFSVMCMTLASCNGGSHEEHTFGDAWSFDAETHYHMCEGCNEKEASAAHEDANNDGACDVCAIIMDNNHVFDTAWSSDANNHWHAPLCGHSVEGKDKGAHTFNASGVCTACGYNSGAAVDISTVSSAIAAAIAAQGSVAGGKFTADTGTEIVTRFTYGEDYLHIVDIENKTETFVTKNEDGTVCQVILNRSDYLNPTTINPSVDSTVLNGVEVNLENYIGISQTVYGVAELLSFLYNDLVSEIVEGETVTESIEDGVYSFSYNFTGVNPITGFGTISYSLQVEFKLDEEKSFVDDFKMVIQNTFANYEVALNYEQWITPDAEYKLEDITPDSFTFVAESEGTLEFTNGVSQTVEVTYDPTATTTFYSIYIENITPSGALMEALGVSAVLNDKSGNDTGAYVTYNGILKDVRVYFNKVGNFDLYITVGEEVYIVPFVVKDVNDSGDNSGDGEDGIEPDYNPDDVTFETFTGGTLTVNAGNPGIAYKFTAKLSGTYQITFTDPNAAVMKMLASGSEEIESGYTFELSAGDSIAFIMCTIDFSEADQYSVTIEQI